MHRDVERRCSCAALAARATWACRGLRLFVSHVGRLLERESLLGSAAAARRACAQAPALPPGWPSPRTSSPAGIAAAPPRPRAAPAFCRQVTSASRSRRSSEPVAGRRPRVFDSGRTFSSTWDRARRCGLAASSTQWPAIANSDVRTIECAPTRRSLLRNNRRSLACSPRVAIILSARIDAMSVYCRALPFRERRRTDRRANNHTTAQEAKGSARQEQHAPDSPLPRRRSRPPPNRHRQRPPGARLVVHACPRVVPGYVVIGIATPIRFATA